MVMQTIFLIKNGYAVEANNAALSTLSAQKKKEDKLAAEELAEAKALKEKNGKFNSGIKSEVW